MDVTYEQSFPMFHIMLYMFQSVRDYYKPNQTYSVTTWRVLTQATAVSQFPTTYYLYTAYTNLYTILFLQLVYRKFTVLYNMSIKCHCQLNLRKRKQNVQKYKYINVSLFGGFSEMFLAFTWLLWTHYMLTTC